MKTVVGRSWLFAALGVGVACASDSGQCPRVQSGAAARVEPAEPGSRSEEGAAQTVGEASPEIGPPEVRLLEVGDSPFALLRWQVEPSAKQRLRVVVRHHVEMTIGPMKVPAAPTPAIVLELTLAAKTPGMEDRFVIQYRIDRATLESGSEVLPEVAAAMQQEAERLQGQSGELHYSPAGLPVIGPEFGAPEEASTPDSASPTSDTPPAPATSSGSTLPDAADGVPAIRAMVEQLLRVVSWPEEPVGPGARWEVVQRVREDGVTKLQRAVYQLVEREGSQVRLKTYLDQGAHPQPMTGMGLASARLLSLAAAGDGELLLDLTLPGVTAGRFRSVSELEVSGELGGKKQQMKVASQVSLEIGPVPSP